MADSQLKDIYNIATWGRGFFGADAQGELWANPKGNPENRHIPFSSILDLIRSEKLTLPVLVRFADILQQQVARLAQSFTDSMKTIGYRGSYLPVYPVKVNQQQSVVEALLGAPYPLGLEAGSKPELLAVLALAPKSNGVIVCNGYKDREYVRLALIGQQLGHQVYLVIEKLSELQLVLDEARKMGVVPHLGVRVRLAAISAGNWQNTGGAKAKFGLTAAQLLSFVEALKEASALDCLRLMHFHIGSQVSNIRDIQRSLAEAVRFYAELRRLGAPIEIVDVGGGLSVDYEGTCTRSACSTNYGWDEYARHVVQALFDICEQQQLPHPNIITESGRAMTAHHAVLITEVIDVEAVQPVLPTQSPAELHNILGDLKHCAEQLNANNALEMLHESEFLFNDVQQQYTQGTVDLAVRAQAEQFYQYIAWQVRDLLTPRVRHHRDVLDDLNEKLADKYFCNFSVFQSTPDVWGIDQIFPIVPLQNLHQASTRRAILQDMTCDSDGRIDRYVDGQGVESSLPLPAFDANQPYYLGIFMVGAYQEILGDMHNLFGDTDAIQVRLDEGDQLQLEHITHGDTVSDVLRYVRFNLDELSVSYRDQLQSTTLDDATQTQYLQHLEHGLQGYTYLEER